MRDLNTAIRQWTTLLGVGPFFCIERVTLPECIYAGGLTNPDLSVALAYSGELQIELMSQRNDAPSMWRSFIEAGHEGYHHVAYWTEDYETDLAALIARGLQIDQSVRGASGSFAYMSPGAGAPPIVELSELDASKKAVFELVAAASRTWDGSDPVRELNVSATTCSPSSMP